MAPLVAGSPPLQVARDGRLGSRLVNTNYNNFAPRVGIAWSPSEQWSVRAGFGMFYSQESKTSIFDLNRGLGGRTGQNALGGIFAGDLEDAALVVADCPAILPQCRLDENLRRLLKVGLGRSDQARDVRDSGGAVLQQYDARGVGCE